MSEQEQENESSVIKELRQQLKDANARLKTLEPMARQSAFKEAGIDTESGPGKFFAEKYDGDLTAEAIREAAEPYGFVSSEQTADAQQPSGPDEQTERITQLRSASTPEGAGKRLSFPEWQQLSKVDPAAAKEAHDTGMVDIPPHIAQSLAAS